MDKKFIDYNSLFKQEAKKRGFIIVQKKDLKDLMRVTTPAFNNYSLYKYFTPKFNLKAWIKFKWRAFKAVYKEAVIFTDPTWSCSVVIFCNDYVKTKTSTYILNGMLKSYFSMGFKAMKKINKFEEFALKIRKKHTNCKCIYCYDLGIKKTAQGQGLARKINETIQDFCDKYQRDAYFETHSKHNEEIYKNLGFTLVETLMVPDTNEVQYCFMYKHKNIKK